MSSSREQNQDSQGQAARATAAKLHVLHMAPIKDKLAGKWPKLSELVHKLFEGAIKEAQGPLDHFILLDELSYVVTFNGLAFEEATLACAAIAKEVCERLFGGTAAEISVRALVGEFSDGILSNQFKDGAAIGALLELSGREIVVSNNPKAPPATVTQVTPGVDDVAWMPINTIIKARATVLPLGLEIGMFPIWELARKTSSCVYALPYSRNRTPKMGCMRRLLAGLPDKVVDGEIALLMAAHAYARRVVNDHKVCAVGAAVSYDTLTSFNSRIRYITVLKSLQICPECPLILKIEEIPAGTLLGKLAELISMLAVPNVRFSLLFGSPGAIPDKINFRLGAAGIGIALPHNCVGALAATFMKKLVHSFSEQKGFVFLEDLEIPELVIAAQASGIRFGTGQALGHAFLTGVDPVPSFPLGC
jgi:hypothetical protein